METKFVYWDDIYTNGKGKYCTEQYLSNNFYEKKDDIYVSSYDTYTKVEDTYNELKGKTVRCNYSQLFHDDDTLLLCNNIREVDETIFDNIENGILWSYEDADGNTITEEEYLQLYDEGAYEIEHEIYQYYLIDDMCARSLINHTDNIVMYSDKLDLYVLGVTHFGTSWSYVAEDFVW